MSSDMVPPLEYLQTSDRCTICITDADGVSICYINGNIRSSYVHHKVMSVNNTVMSVNESLSKFVKILVRLISYENR